MRWTSLTSVLSLIGSTVALAQAPAPEPFIRTRVPDKDLCLAWTTRAYVYNYHSAGSQQTPGTAEFVAMDAAFETWRAAAKTCSDFEFIKGPLVGVANIGYDKDSSDNTNVIVFRERSCKEIVPSDDPCLLEGTCRNTFQCWDESDTTIAITTSTFSYKTGVIYDADIEFNAGMQENGERFLFTTISSPQCEPGAQSPLCVATDVQNTLTHEIGHVVGLDHVDVPGATMEASAPLGETRKRILDTGTRDGFCHIYPANKPTPPCEDVNERVFAVNRGTPGLEQVGCHAGGAGLSFAAVLLAVALARRRQNVEPHL